MSSSERPQLRRLCSIAAISLMLFGCGIEATPVTLDVVYTEPVVNADGTPLEDLGTTRVYCSVAGAPPSERVTTPASNLNGGAMIQVLIPLDVPAGAETSVDCHATATDLSGNESADSNHIVVTYDFLPPAPPEVQ